MKDLVDHIRTVHFTVFVVALVLTIAAHSQKKPQLDRAASDAEAVLLLNQKWPAVRSAMAKAADEGLSRFAVTSLVERGSRFLPLEDPGLYVLKGSSVYPGRPLVFGVRRKWIYVDETEPDENPGWGESEEFMERLPTAWANLKDFFGFWDGFHDGRRAFVSFALAAGNSAGSCGNIEKVRGGEREVTAFLVLHPTLQENWRLSFGVEGMDRDVNKHKHACDFAPVSVSRWQGDLASVWAGIAPQAGKWGARKSADEFKDLTSETKYLEELPIEKLAAALRERANSDTDRIELFQAKLPAEAISTYGALLLIASQLYLLAHLLELRRLARTVDRAEWPTGYVALYQNPLIATFTFVSLVLWPPYPLWVLARRSSGASPVYGWTALAGSAAIAIASAFVLALVRRAKPAPPEEKRAAASPA